MAPIRNNQNICFIDLEMTGLDPQRDVILQAALIITNGELETIDEYSCDIWQPESELEKMTPFVRAMHEKTGLLERVRASMVDTREAERQILHRVSYRCPHPAILAGNSVWVDRGFIDRHMPGLGGYLHYRLLDVTSVRLAVERFFGTGAAFDKPTEGEHDALVDIRNSIAELKHYRSVMKPPKA
ncbi:MAG: oligoribonuclease [Myxococcales bacterium]|nr:oligoribonuclease [Myxococcales bacterium]